MKERPILFNGGMVRAILDGRKTQTRRVIKDLPSHGDEHQEFFDLELGIDEAHRLRGWEAEYPEEGSQDLGACPFGQPGDRLWVRETWADLRGRGFDAQVGYSADTRPGSDGDEARKAYGVKWKPSIHMPRWASRITLEVTGVRVERLQEISEQSAQAEGIDWLKNPAGDAGWGPPAEGAPPNRGYTHRYAFKELWDSIYSKAQYRPTGFEWASNPWVWVVEFKRVQP